MITASLLFAQPILDASPSRKYLHQGSNTAYEPARADSAHGFDVQKYEITLSINTTSRVIEGNVLATVLAEEALTSISYELVSLTVSSVLVNGQAAAYTHSGGILNITANIPAGQQFTTQVFYSGIPQLTANNYQIGMIFGTNTVFTISDPDAARNWWPCYDHPWDKAIVDLHITMRSDWKVAANGLRSEIVNLGNGNSTTHWLGSNPMTTYLVCITAGPYVEINQTVPSQNNLPVQNFVTQSQYNNALIDLQYLPAMISYFSDIFGDYPFEKYGNATVNMSTYGAMEHQTMTTLGNYIINGNQTYELTIAHELAHQWFGNAVSFLTFKDVWLSEGFATYSEHLWTDKRFGWQAAANYVASGYHQYYISWENNLGPQTIYNPSFYNYFAPPSYEKAASVLHMLRLKIGNDNFFQLLQQWFATYNGGNAVTAEFQAMAEQISGQNLQQFFSQWIYGSGTPSMEYSVWQAEDISRVKIHAKSTSPSSTQFHLEVPFRISNGTVADSLLAFASPQGQATEFLCGQSIHTSTVTPNYNSWTMLKQITERKPVLVECIPSWGAVLVSWDVFMPGVDAGYLVYRRMNQSWELLTDAPVTDLSYVDSTPFNAITYEYAIAVVDASGFISQLSNIMTAMPMPLTFDYDLLLVDETRDGTGTGISPNDVQVDGFYGSAVEPLVCDFWDCSTQGLPLLSNLGMYKVVLWYADDFSQNLLADNMNLISGYILGGGKLLLSCWKTPSVFNTAFLNRFAGGVTLNYDNSASLISAYSTQYPNLLVDPNKTTASWNNMLPQIYTFNNAPNSIYTATMNPGSAGADQCAAFRYTSTGTLVLLGFPLYFMQAEGVRGFLQQILPELINGTANEDELVSMKPASLNSSPNPFNPSTTISFYNPVAGDVSINLYNMKGQKVREILSTRQNSGTHNIVFDGLDNNRHSLASGVYFLRYTHPQGSLIKKITLMK
jgi:hypothetical protein